MNKNLIRSLLAGLAQDGTNPDLLDAQDVARRRSVSPDDYLIPPLPPDDDTDDED